MLSSYKCLGASGLKKTYNWQLVVGIIFLVFLFVLAVVIPNPTSWQTFIFRRGFAISLAATAAIIPGLLTFESRFQKLSIRATGAIAIFIIIWLVNPPELNDSNREIPPSEKLMMDSHKTEIVIDRVELNKFHGIDEPYVVMVLKNISEVTAKNLNISFISKSKEIFTMQDGVRELWRPRNFAIYSREETLIPVAPFSEYTAEIFEDNPETKW